VFTWSVAARAAGDAPGSSRARDPATNDTAAISDAAAISAAAATKLEEQTNATLARARDLFRTGVVAVEQAQWAEALTSFEASRQLRPHAVTTFNIGACERALGRYTRARREFSAALDEERGAPGQLASSLIDDAKAFLAEADGIVARVKLRVHPEGAILAVDGRPIVVAPHAGSPNSTDVLPVYIAGLAAPGLGAVAPKGQFLLLLDPGAHTITLRRKGYTDVVVQHVQAPGSQTELALELERLPATLRIDANVPDTLVRFDDIDVGPTPLVLRRPAGPHRVELTKAGYEPYVSELQANPGERIDISASLVAEKPSLLRQWWFWTAAALVLGGAAFGTYALTRESEPPPPYAGGSTNWVAFPTN
jgi:hypothetical protein